MVDIEYRLTNLFIPSANSLLILCPPTRVTKNTKSIHIAVSYIALLRYVYNVIYRLWSAMYVVAYTHRVVVNVTHTFQSYSGKHFSCFSGNVIKFEAYFLTKICKAILAARKKFYVAVKTKETLQIFFVRSYSNAIIAKPLSVERHEVCQMSTYHKQMWRSGINIILLLSISERLTTKVYFIPI